jgi:hypothetical protein
MRSAKQLRLLVAILLLAANILACNFMSQDQKQPSVIQWDLSNSHSVQDVGWSVRHTDKFSAREGNFLLKMNLASGLWQRSSG